MKKSKKGYILLGITTSIIATSGMIKTIKPLKINLRENKSLEYNHNPATALDNVFEKDGLLILPFIYNNAEQRITKNDIIAEFYKAGLTIKEISTGEKIGTGTQITVNENPNVVYTVLVYGDVTGDGVVNLIDAQKIISSKIYPDDPTFLIEGIYHIAANVQNTTDDLDLIDAQKIIMFKKKMLNEPLVKNEPIAIKETKTLESISAEYNNSVAVSAATTLDEIKPNVIVKAHYSNGDIETVSTFDLTGSLLAGETNSLTVSALGKTTSITVTVAERELTRITAVYNDDVRIPVTTKLNSLKSSITVTGIYNNGTTDSITEFELDGVLHPGETNTIKVKAQGKETIITVSVEEDTVTGITLETAPTKLIYNYGEETLDLVGGEIRINYLVGGEKTEDITNGMVSGYDPRREGTQTITITYGGATTQFEVTVLNKISALELKDGKNVTAVSGGYKTKAKEEFTLGTIQPANKDKVSSLDPNMITVNADATEEFLKIEKVVDENGNVILKGKAEEVGTYKITVTLTYEGETPIDLDINLVAEKCTTIGKVRAETVTNELRAGHPIVANILVYNEHGDLMEPETIEVEEVEGITIIKLDEYGAPTTDSSKIKAIRISTTLEKGLEEAVTFNVKAKGIGTDNEATTPITLQINDAPVLKSVAMNENNISLYTEEKENTKVDGTNIYTLFEVNFLDQIGEAIEYSPSNLIKIVNEDDLEDLTLQKGQAAVVLPKVMVKSKSSSKQKLGIGLDIKFYDESGKDATTVVKQLGIAYMKDLEGKEVVLSSIVGKNIKIIDNNKNVIKEIPLNIVLKELSTIQISEEGRENITKDTTTGAYVVELDKEFTIGTINVKADEGPLTAKMLEQDTEIEGDIDGITITYDDTDGPIILKGTITKAGEYKITPKAGTVKAINPITIEAKEIPTVPIVTGVELSKKTVEIGKSTISNLKVETNLNPEGETVLVRDIKLDYNPDEIDVKFLKPASGNAASGFETDKELDEVSGLKITAKITDDETVNLKITLFEGEENEETVTIPILVYKPIPRYIEIDNSVSLSKSNYNTVAIKAYADAAKQEPVTLNYNMFEVNSEEENEEANKIYITIPKVLVSKGNNTKNYEIISWDFQDKNNNSVNSTDNKEITYIGFKVEVPDGFTVEDANLNGVTITLKSTAENGETKTITTSYTAP